MHRLNVVALCLTCCLAARVAAVEPTFDSTPREKDDQKLIIPRIDVAPTIDGDLSDATWDKAVRIQSFWLGGTDEVAEKQTTAWLAFDNDNLYIAYACEDEHVQTDKYPHDDKHIWMRDGVEVHLSPTRDPKNIYQFIFGPGGSTFELHSAAGDYADQVAWNPPVVWEGKAKMQPFGYTAELRIPLAAVIDRDRYDVDRGTWWQVKLTRLDYGGHDNVKLYSWTRIGSHTSDKFSLGDIYFESRNLIDNGSAEIAGEDGAPTGWQFPHHGMTLHAGRAEVDTTHGQYAARVEIRGEPAGGINSRIYAGRVARHRAPVETTYRFSADVKVESDPGGLTSYYVVFNGDEVGQLKFDHNKGWQHVDALVTVVPGKQTNIPAIQSTPSNRGETPGGVILVDNVRFEPITIDDIGGDPDAVCLTGNAFGAQRTRNGAIAGTYTYREPGTIGGMFPNYLRDETFPDYLEYAGDIPFDKGILTDGLTATGPNWGMFWTGAQGREFLFDLKEDFIVTRVVVLGARVGYGQVFTKATGDPRFALVSSTRSLYDWDMGIEQDLPDAESVHNVNMPARWVRIQLRVKQSSPKEIQIWGKPYDGAPVERKVYLQNGGKTPIKEPKSEPIVYKDIPPVFPHPQEMKIEGAALPLRDGMTIGHAATDRARVTAEVLAEEFETCFDLKFTVREGEGDITLGEGDAAPDKQDGYLLTVGGSKVTITGHDPRGTFYGTQSLLSLVRRDDADGWEIPGATIRDWPDMTVRYIQGRPEPGKNLVRACARFRVTHYEPHPKYHAQAATWDAEAERYFVQFVPHLSFNRTVLTKDKSLVEIAPDEAVESLGHGRWNANPAHPRSWEIYLAEVNKWLPQFHGDLVHINYDETYQSQGGARWNVSKESRALNLTAGELIAYQINRINDAFKKYGKSVVMHDTAFMSNHSLSYPGDPDPSWNNAIPLLPRDVKFLVWHPDTAGPRLHKAGFELYWLPLDERDWRKDDLPSIFTGVTAYMAESAFTPSKLINQMGVTWNLSAPRPRDPYANTVTASYIPVWRELHEGIAKPSRYAQPRDYTTIDISAAANRSRIDKVAYDGEGFVDMGANVDMRALPSGRLELAGVPFDIVDEASHGGKSFVMVHDDGYADQTLPSQVTIDVEDFRASSLVFLHSLEHRPGHNYLRRKELAGFYIMEYDDGTYGPCEIKYAVNTANWSGRPVNSGYNPKGHTMTDGFLAWKGESTSGLPVYLYATEWANPRPDKTVARIHVRTPDSLTRMNPMLFAVTALHPRLASKKAEPPEMPSIDRLAPAQPVGTFYDLAGGVDESDTRYVASDGTVISCDQIYNLSADNIAWAVIQYRSKVGMVNVPGNYATAQTHKVDYAFPQPTDVTGALVTGGYRRERKTEDFDAVILNLTCYASTDGGETWTEQSKALNVSPEEHGPQWLSVSAGSVTHLRFTIDVVSGYTHGFEQIKIFRR